MVDVSISQPSGCQSYKVVNGKEAKIIGRWTRFSWEREIIGCLFCRDVSLVRSTSLAGNAFVRALFCFTDQLIFTCIGECTTINYYHGEQLSQNVWKCETVKVDNFLSNLFSSSFQFVLVSQCASLFVLIFLSRMGTTATSVREKIVRAEIKP
jgi:hypothetical protein